jgi:hypothetical protein
MIFTHERRLIVCLGDDLWLSPGTMIRHSVDRESMGTIIALDEETVTVIWSVIPNSRDIREGRLRGKIEDDGPVFGFGLGLG